MTEPTDIVMPILLGLQESMRAMRNEMRTFRVETQVEFHDLKARLSGLEQAYVVLQSSIDRVQEHLQRVDRRLELHDE